MINLKSYAVPENISDAWQILIEDKRSVILGGCAFLRLGKKQYSTGIDLKKLGLSYVSEHDNHIEIGSMSSLRELETNNLLSEYCDGILKNAVSNIVGVSFRNTATIGGSVCGKFGFSDVTTALLALDAKLNFYNNGIISIEEFLNSKPDRDILISILLPKNEKSTGRYYDLRSSKGDFPILAVAVTSIDHKIRISVGARPMGAVIPKKTLELISSLSFSLSDSDIAMISQYASEELIFGTNMRGESLYRKHLCKVFVARGLMEVAR